MNDSMEYRGRYIRWTLAEGAIEPFDPLGDFSITGDLGSISEASTLLDAYLEALAQGLKWVGSKLRLEIDVVVEPYVLVVSLDGDTLLVEHRGESVRISDRAAFLADLVGASSALLRVLDDAADTQLLPRAEQPLLRTLTEKT